MELKVERFSDNDESTLGRLYIDGMFECYTCEDAHREIKVKGRTRIPAGTYRVFLRALGTSHFDPKYTEDFGSDWYHGMLQLASVPGFEGVEIHIGNSAKDTDGCILVGKAFSQAPDENGSMQVRQSTLAFKQLYPKVRDELERGEAVHITVEGNDQPLTS